MKASTNDSSVSDLDQNSEDVLTRHLLKLSEIEISLENSLINLKK